MSAADRVRSALDALRDSVAMTPAETRVAAFLREWTSKPTRRAVVSTLVDTEVPWTPVDLRVDDLEAILVEIQALRLATPKALPSSLPTHRRSDPSTSRRAGQNPDRVRRATSQAVRLLLSYDAVDRLDPDGAETPVERAALRGMTDAEARVAAELSPRSCYWKRCSELRAEGLIEVVKAPVAEAATRIVTVPGANGTERVVARIAAYELDVTRPDPETGEERIVCRITDAGRRELARVGSAS